MSHSLLTWFKKLLIFIRQFLNPRKTTIKQPVITTKPSITEQIFKYLIDKRTDISMYGGECLHSRGPIIGYKKDKYGIPYVTINDRKTYPQVVQALFRSPRSVILESREDDEVIKGLLTEYMENLPIDRVLTGHDYLLKQPVGEMVTVVYSNGHRDRGVLKGYDPDEGTLFLFREFKGHPYKMVIIFNYNIVLKGTPDLDS